MYTSCSVFNYQNRICMNNELYAQISFYIVAHADDWLLFMQPNAHKDLVDSHNKVVFIISTAGDAGEDEKYWCAREEGIKSSIRFCLAPLVHLFELNNRKEINYHIIN